MTESLPLVLIPGLLCTEALWRPQIEHLSDVAEAWVPKTSRHDNISRTAEDILAAAPAQFALAGLSMGGYVAFEILRQQPSRVRKLALLDTNARADVPEQAARRRAAMQRAKEQGNLRGVVDELMPILLHPDRLRDRTLTRLIHDMADEIGVDGYIRQQTAIIERPDNRPFLSRIDCPTTVIVGRQDALTPPKVAQEMADGIPGAEIAVIEDCGHLSTLERPEAVNAELRRWLSASQSSEA
jgi:pimeloyl-ACP methyl ester carboxylesterase